MSSSIPFDPKNPKPGRYSAIPGVLPKDYVGEVNRQLVAHTKMDPLRENAISKYEDIVDGLRPMHEDALPWNMQSQSEEDIYKNYRNEAHNLWVQTPEYKDFAKNFRYAYNTELLKDPVLEVLHVPGYDHPIHTTLSSRFYNPPRKKGRKPISGTYP